MGVAVSGHLVENAAKEQPILCSSSRRRCRNDCVFGPVNWGPALFYSGLSPAMSGRGSGSPAEEEDTAGAVIKHSGSIDEPFQDVPNFSVNAISDEGSQTVSLNVLLWLDILTTAKLCTWPNYLLVSNGIADLLFGAYLFSLTNLRWLPKRRRISAVTCVFHAAIGSQRQNVSIKEEKITTEGSEIIL
ncbi:hypothetical protein BV898_17081 [Hypsibius exemplaris]|uniref:Uncharacterized protein n=1 Tax=Hypsibius exemplaris TaxID=2072580 RepID=A0A9X6NG47_HYPEX|nr:hypothetical protein BV898_17081 [Hypsibius exemplaris]